MWGRIGYLICMSAAHKSVGNHLGASAPLVQNLGCNVIALLAPADIWTRDPAPTAYAAAVRLHQDKAAGRSRASNRLPHGCH